MLKDLFSNRLFIGALAFSVFCFVGSLLYMQHVEHQSAKELAETLKHIEQRNELQNQQPIMAAPVVEPPPHKQYTKGSVNPGPFKNVVPVDLSDFEATKALMIESVNFVKENWDPKVFNLEVRVARLHIFNISSYADSMFCFYTPEQREEISALRFSLLDVFKGIDRK